MKRITVKVWRRLLKFDLSDLERKLILDEICYSQNYFPRINHELDFKINPKDTVLDIGAHVGIFSIFAANLANRGKVYSFEPVRENFERLQRHISLNHLQNITAENVGVSDRLKRATIYLIKKNSGGHSLYRGKFKRLHEKIRSAEIVDLVPLRAIFDKYHIRHCDFLKLDCEGEEYKILTGLPGNYFRRIDKVVMEYHATVINEARLVRLLIKRGFIVTISYYGPFLGMIFAKRKRKKRS